MGQQHHHDCAGMLRSWLMVSDSHANGASFDALFFVTSQGTTDHVPHTPTSCHLCNRCSRHARVCSGKTRCLEYRANSGHYHPAHTFIPASVETYGYLGKPLVRHLKTLSEVVAVTKGSFLAGAHRELSVVLIKCQGSVYRGCANLLARAAGRQVSPAAEVPYED